MNKGIYLKTADIYLRFPEIMEEECNDLAEFLEDEHIVYEGATDIVYNLQQENQQLKEIEKEHQRINGELRVENQKLKDNWNKLKEIIKKKFVAQGGFTSYEWNDLLNELLDKMQEIELKGDKE